MATQRIVTLDDQGKLQFAEDKANGTDKVAIKAPAVLAASIELTLPDALPAGTEFMTLTAGGVIATTVGASGTLDQAYDSGGAGGGRSVTVDTGAVQLVNADENDILELKAPTPGVVFTTTGATHRNARILAGADTLSIQRGDDDADGTDDSWDDLALFDTENRRMCLGVAVAPLCTLHVEPASSGAAVAVQAATDVLIESDGASFIEFIGPNTIEQGLYFSDDAGNAGRIGYRHDTNLMALYSAGTVGLVIDASQNVAIGNATAWTSGTNILSLAEGTAPSGGTAGMAGLFADTIADVELRAIDSAGNITTLSPHPWGRHLPSERMAWAYRSERDGWEVFVDMMKVVRELEQISGKTFIEIYRKDGPAAPPLRGSPVDYAALPGVGADRAVTSPQTVLPPMPPRRRRPRN